PFLVLALGLALIAAACGGDGGGYKVSGKFSFTNQTTASNKRRELTEQILQQQLRTAGFDVKIKNVKVGDLFGDILPKGAYQVGLYAGSVTSFFPVGCNIFCSKNIPKAPKFTGNNWQRVNIPAVDPILERVESSLDPAVGTQSNKQADPILAD